MIAKSAQSEPRPKEAVNGSFFIDLFNREDSFFFSTHRLVTASVPFEGVLCRAMLRWRPPPVNL